MTTNKLQEAILYFAVKSRDDQAFGATKLNKLLWFADAEHWGRNLESITGASYVRMPNGPGLGGADSIERALGDAGEVYDDGDYKRVHVRRGPDLTAFTPEEIRMMDAVLARHKHHNADELSSRSHNMGWQRHVDGQVMPLSAYFYSDAAHEEMNQSLPAPKRRKDFDGWLLEAFAK